MLPAMAEDMSARPNTWHWPPLLYGAVLFAAMALEQIAPLPALPGGSATKDIGLGLLVFGLVLGAMAIVQFVHAGTPVDPTARAKALVTTGVYRFTRNPMYLGMVNVYLGAGTVFGSSWLVVLAVVMAFALARLAIVREEAYLTARFGDAYRAYQAATPRWLGPV